MKTKIRLELTQAELELPADELKTSALIKYLEKQQAHVLALLELVNKLS